MINYQLKTDEIIKNLKNTPSLLLHVCCAPCSSYVLEYLTEYFAVTAFFYNPNITEKEEYEKRKTELKRFVSQREFRNSVNIIDGDYEPELFFEIAKGMEKLCEGTERCFRCYELRLRKTAGLAKKMGVDFFCTTLSVSPHKNAQKLNEIGERLSNEYSVPYLFSDFKKKNGYKRSIELSEEYGLYRQNYCGCIFSRQKNIFKNSKKQLSK